MGIRRDSDLRTLRVAEAGAGPKDGASVGNETLSSIINSSSLSSSAGVDFGNEDVLEVRAPSMSTSSPACAVRGVFFLRPDLVLEGVDEPGSECETTIVMGNEMSAEAVFGQGMGEKIWCCSAFSGYVAN